MKLALSLVSLCFACGDNGVNALPDGPPVTGCIDVADPAPTGLLATRDELPALSGCVTGGMQDLARQVWFIRANEPTPFGYRYLDLASSCERGLEVGTFDYTWSDGTNGFVRRGFVTPDFQFVTAAALCAGPDMTMRYISRRCVKIGEDPVECEDGSLATGHVYPVLGEVGRNVTLLGSDVFDEPALDVDVKGTVAYVATGLGLRTYDISGGGLTLLGTVDLPEAQSINDVEVLESGGRRYAYVSDDTTLIVDVTDPASMIIVGPIDTSGRSIYSHTLQIGLRGTTPTLYLAGQEGVPVYGLGRPTTPDFVANVPLEQPGTHDLTPDGDRLYVNNEFGGFVALDISDVNAPVELRRHIGGYYNHASSVGTVAGRPLVVEGGEGFEPDGTGTRLRIYDGNRSSPDYLSLLGQYATRPETGIHNMIVRGDYVYIAYYQDGLRVVNLANPAAPVEVAHYNSWDRSGPINGAFAGAIGIDVADDGTIILVNFEGSVMRLAVTDAPQ